MFFDPPYYGSEKVYGTLTKKCTFDHQEFHDRISQLDNKWILTYKEHEVITDLYKDYRIIKYQLRHSIAAKGNKKASELFILNY